MISILYVPLRCLEPKHFDSEQQKLLNSRNVQGVTCVPSPSVQGYDALQGWVATSPTLTFTHMGW